VLGEQPEQHAQEDESDGTDVELLHNDPGREPELMIKVATTVDLIPAVAYDDEKGNPYRVVRAAFNKLPKTSPLRVEVHANAIAGKPTYLHKLCAARFLKMAEVAEAEAGFILKLNNGWRPHNYKDDHAYYCKEMKKKYPKLTCKQAGAWIAFTSPHETGLAFDLGGSKNTIFAPAKKSKSAQEKSPAFKWLKANAHRFGITPYKNEPWHWECVITRHAWATGIDFVDESGYETRVREIRDDTHVATSSANFG